MLYTHLTHLTILYYFFQFVCGYQFGNGYFTVTSRLPCFSCVTVVLRLCYGNEKILLPGNRYQNE